MSDDDPDPIDTTGVDIGHLIWEARRLRTVRSDWTADPAYSEIKDRLTEDYHDLCTIRERDRTEPETKYIKLIEDLYPHLRTTPTETQRLDFLINWINARHNTNINRYNIDLTMLEPDQPLSG